MAIYNKIKNKEPEIISVNDDGVISISDAKERSVSHTGWEDYSGWANMKPILDDLAKRGISTNYGSKNVVGSENQHEDEDEEPEVIPSNDARGRNEVY